MVAGYLWLTTSQKRTEKSKPSTNSQVPSSESFTSEEETGVFTINYDGVLNSYDTPSSYGPGPRGAKRDERLDCAAKLLVAYPANLPDDAVSFALHVCGVAQYTAARSVISSNQKFSKKYIKEALSKVDISPNGYFGYYTKKVGREYLLLVIHLSRDFSITNAPRQSNVNSAMNVTVDVQGPSEGFSVLVHYPDGSIKEWKTQRELSFSTGPSPGVLELDVHNIVQGSPVKLFQIPIYIGVNAARKATFAVGELANPKTEEEASEYARFLFDQTREEHQKDSLEHDPELEKIARKHNLDMIKNDFMGHRSPSTGLPQDRMEQAGYWAEAAGENLARNSSVWGAQHGLYQSLGHRQNLLSDKYTHVGISAVRGTNNQWFVTQVFATPIEKLDEKEIADSLTALINSHRKSENFPGLILSDELVSSAESIMGFYKQSRDSEAAFNVGKKRLRDAGYNGSAIFQLQAGGSPSLLDVTWSDSASDATDIGLTVEQNQSTGEITVVWVLGKPN